MNSTATTEYSRLGVSRGQTIQPLGAFNLVAAMSSLIRAMSRRVSCRNDSISASLNIVGLRQALGLGLCECVESVACCGPAFASEGLDASTGLAFECMSEAESSALQHHRASERLAARLAKVPSK